MLSRFLIASVLVVGSATTSYSQADIDSVPAAPQEVDPGAALQQMLSSPSVTDVIATAVLPSGAVVAFDRPRCPRGWSDYVAGRGRALIGTNPDSSNGLSVRALGAMGGAETHTLTIAEMPTHHHQSLSSNGYDSPRHTDTSPEEFGDKNMWQDTSSTGGNQAHNNMQPFVALLWCKKN